eukprot:634744-Prorocentrum_minimum.AAC.6
MNTRSDWCPNSITSTLLTRPQAALLQLSHFVSARHGSFRDQLHGLSTLVGAHVMIAVCVARNVCKQSLGFPAVARI